VAPTDDAVPDLDEWRKKSLERLREGPRYYNRQGEPITLDEWCKLAIQVDAKRVALSAVGPYVVSTVWLGLDHGFSLYEDAPPIIFESMVFARGGWESDRDARGRKEDDAFMEFDMERYSTEQQALDGHRAMVETIAATAQDVDGSAYEIEWEYEE
jgi:hypothetical protein